MLIRNHRPTINFLDAYRSHYGSSEEDVTIQEIVRFEGQAPAIKLVLASGRSDFCYFLFSALDGPFYPSMNSEFDIPFFGAAREWHGQFRPVYKRGEGPTTYAVQVTLKTAEEYAAGGDLHPPLVTVQISPPLDFVARTPESWAVPVPTEAERQFARQTWGAQVAGARSDYDKAKALARILCEQLWPHSGMPIPEMSNYGPFDMYRAMVSGRSKGFCVQFGMIFVHACKCFDVVARNLHVERPVTYDERLRIFLGGMHCASEIFDRVMNRWIFMDLRFYCLGAYLGEEGPLSLGEFHLFMCQPQWRDRLRFQVYDLASGTEKRLPMSECPRTNIDFYAGWHTVFHVGYP